MNKVHTIFWNASLACWTVASEFATTKGKSSRKVVSGALIVASSLSIVCAQSMIVKSNKTDVNTNIIGIASNLAIMKPNNTDVVANKTLVMKPNNTDAAANEPLVMKPNNADAAANKPLVMKPNNTDVTANKTLVMKPNNTDAAANEPLVMKPNNADAAANKPLVMKPNNTDVAANEPLVMKPNNTDVAENKTFTVVADNKTAIIMPSVSDTPSQITSGFASRSLTTSSNVGNFVIVDYDGQTTYQAQVTLNSRSIAAGFASKAKGASSAAFGRDSQALGDEATAAGGNKAIASGTRSTALGSNTTASGGYTVAIGSAAEASSEYSIALGDAAKVYANSADAMAVGVKSEVTGQSAIALGNLANANGLNAMAMGTSGKASGLNSTAIGSFANTVGELGVALGSSSNASGKNSVALGASSVATVENTVSVGNVGTERRIMNVAAGTLDTDAVVFSQLKATTTSIATALGGGASLNAVNGTLNAPTYAIQKGSFSNVGAALEALDTSVDTNITNIANNLASINQNKIDITANTTLIGTNKTATDTTIADNKTAAEAAIATNATNITANTTLIGTNKTVTDTTIADNKTAAEAAIATNATNITANTTLIGTNKTATDTTIADNKTAAEAAIATNATNITANTTLIGTNKTATDTTIADNKTAAEAAIATNATNITANTTLIGTNKTATDTTIADNKTAAEAAIATNATNITANTTLIGTNKTATDTTIADNKTAAEAAIATNATNITANTTLIGTNKTATDTTIADNKTAAEAAITTNATNITANTTLIGTNKTATDTTIADNKTAAEAAIATNATNITANTTLIGTNKTVTDITIAANKTVTDTTIAANKAAAEVVIAANATNITATNVNVVGIMRNLGGDAAIDGNGGFVAPIYIIDKKEHTTVKEAFGTLDDLVSTLVTDITNITGGSVGLVQQASDAAEITVAAGSAGSVVNFSGTTGARKLTGIAAGDISASSKDAVTGAQLFTTNTTVADNKTAAEAAIATNATNITANTTLISTNKTATDKTIADNKTAAEAAIATNATNITANTTLIGTNKTATDTTIADNKTAAEAAITTNATNITATNINVAGIMRNLGGDAAIDGNGGFVAPIYIIDKKEHTTVKEAFGTLDDLVSTLVTDITNITGGSVGLVQQASDAAEITVAAGSAGSVVNFSGTTGARKLTGIAAGDISASSKDAVTGAQLFTTNTTVADNKTAAEAAIATNATNITANTTLIGTNKTATDTTIADNKTAAEAAIATNATNITANTTLIGTNKTATDSVIAATNVNVAGIMRNLGGDAAIDGNGGFVAPIYIIDKKEHTTVKEAFGTLDDLVSTLVTDITNITGGSVGLVQQASDAAEITVAAGSAGSVVNFSGTAGARKLTGIAAGDISASSKDAVTGAQLFTTNTTVADNKTAAEAAIATNATNITANTTLIGTNKTATDTTIADNKTAAEAAIATNATNITANTTLIGTNKTATDTTIADNKTAAEAAIATNATNITANTTLIGTNKTATDSVIAATNVNVAGIMRNLGGDAAIDGNGGFVAPTYTIDNKEHTTVKEAFGTLDDLVSTLVTDITNITGGSVGLVQQTSDTAEITVAGNSEGALVNFGSKTGVARKLTGIADGTEKGDAVNFGQLLATGAINGDGSVKNVVTYDTATKDSIALGVNGTPVKITNLADGIDDQDAVNMAQLKKSGTVGEDGKAKNVVVYDSVANEPTNKDTITLGGTGGTILTGLKDGELSATSKDAVTGGQLFTTNSNLTTLSNNAVQYNTDKTSIDLAGKDGAAVRITNLADGITDLDAVNMAQLKKSGTVGEDGKAKNVVVYDSVANEPTNKDTITLGGTGGTILTGLKDGELSATSKDAVTGGQLFTTNSNLTTLSNNAVQYNTDKTSIDLAGKDGAAVRITNLADGITDLDAVNMAQLKKSGTVGEDGKAKNVVVYDSVANEPTNKDTITLGGTGGTILTGLKDGELSATSKDAVTGGQLFTTNTTVADNKTAIATNATNITANTALIGTNKTATDKAIAATNVNVAGIMRNLGGDAAIDSNGGFVAPIYTIDKKEHTTVKEAFGTLDDLVSTLVTDITNITGGSAGLVQQASDTAEITVAGNSEGALVNFGSKTGVARKLTGIAAGRGDTDAANVGQLREVYETIGGTIEADGTIIGPKFTVQKQELALKDSIAALDKSITSIDASVKNGVHYDLNNPNQIILGNQIPRVSVPVSIKNLANGLVASGSLDAVNGGQLYEVSQRIHDFVEGLEGLVQIDKQDANRVNVAAAQTATVLDIAGAAGDRIISGVKDGVADNDAATIGQIKDLILTTNINYANSGMVSVKNTAKYANASAEGENSLSVGAGSVASANNGISMGVLSVASGDTAMAIGVKAVATAEKSIAMGAESRAVGESSVALGHGAQALARNSVALGAGSIADRENTVSVGAVGAERQITNVAAGIAGTDAVNVNQLNAGLSQNAARIQTLDKKINKMDKRVNGGIASAMAVAGIVQNPIAGGSSVGGAIYGFGDQAAMAIGVSSVSKDGHWSVKAAGTITTDGKVGGGAGVSYNW